MKNYVKTPMADVLGGLLADAADTKVEVDAAKAQLIGLAAQDPGVVAFEGDLFRVTVSFGVKKVTDYKGILSLLVEEGSISEFRLQSLLASHTQTAEGVPTVRCTARKGI